MKYIKQIILGNIFLSLLVLILNFYFLFGEYIKLKYEADDFNLVGYDPYEVIRDHLNDSIYFTKIIILLMFFLLISGSFVYYKINSTKNNLKKF